VVLLKELDSARNRNAWYASELELARKAGYVSSAASSQVLEGRGTETFDDEDRPLVEALLAMRTELASVQNAVDERAAAASKQVAEALKQRDAAIQEALYAKAKLAAHGGSAQSNMAKSDMDRGELANRTEEMSRKLSAALHIQKDLQSRLDSARAELDVEKKARHLADDTTNAAQKRLAELESFKQQTSAELERLKAELHLAQREAREQSVASTDAITALEVLKAEKAELSEKYEGLMGSSKGHSDTFDSLRAAIAASESSKAHLQSKLEEERSQREVVQDKLNKLKTEHEARTAELVATTQRLRDAEELAEQHANEAKTHRQVVLAGLDKLTLRDEGKDKKADTDRLAALQNQVSASNALVKKYQQEADAAADKLRSAEERIAGLEQYQEQSSREGVGIRRQLQSALRDTQALQTANAELKSQLAAQQLETNATVVQHNALKDILSERGISPTGAVRSRGLTSPRTNTPDQSRIRDLEAQLANANTAHEETKQGFAIQLQESESAYREKLAQLEGDYQSAVHYVKGTEKMLKQLKDQLARYKTENGQLKTEIEQLESQVRDGGKDAAASAEWATERTSLQKKIDGLESELRSSGAELQKQLDAVRRELSESQKQRDEAIRGTQDATKKLSAQVKSLEQLRAENTHLEQRAVDAEQKVSLLLDQVEHSVDTYRRQSRQELGAETNGTTLGHTRNESSEVESVYEGSHADARNSTALDNLASELETLRSHWEATNKNYRLSTNFDLDANAPAKRDDDGGLGLSESLADWRKKLDTEERTGAAEKARPA
jgi:chromosome segregation ATPase